MKINLQKINLLKIALIVSLIGIFLLLLLSNILELKLISIEKINYSLINKKVKVQGEIFNIKTYEDSDFQVISIKDKTGKIDVIINSPIDNLKDQNAIVIGTVQEYNRHLQIRADKILLE